MKITIIVPVYNVERYLVKCLESIVNQKESFDEVILVNDGSTDNSLSICEKYVASYPNFKLINQSNKGLSAARNAGIKESTGDYIMFLDSDDWLRLDTVTVLKKEVEKTALDAIYFDAEVVYEEDVEKKQSNPYDRSMAKLDGKYMSGLEYLYSSYPRYYVVSACLALYRKDIIEENNISFPEGLYYEDNYFTFVFLKYAQKVEHISEKLYNRLYHSNSIITSKYSNRKFTDFIKCILLIWDEIFLDSQERKFMQFMSGHCNTILNAYEDCQNGEIHLDNTALDLLSQVLDKYVEVLRVAEFPNKVNFSQLTIGIHNLKRIHEWKLLKENMLENILEEAMSEQKICYLEILKELPLSNSSLKIGIYGTGKHTEGLLNIFEKIIGPINCELIYIDSKKDKEIYNNKSLINYQKVDEGFDLIIISSFLYERDMLSNIKSLNLQIPVYTFYDDITIDIFSNYRVFM